MNNNNEKRDVKNNTKTSPEELYEAAEEQAAYGYEKLKNKAESFGEKVKDKADEAYETGKETAKDIKEYIESCPESLAAFIKKQPLTSFLIAGSIGFALSLCMRK